MIRRSKTSSPQANLGEDRFAHRGARWLMCPVAIAALATSAAIAQDQPTDAAINLPALSYHVPDEVGLFVEIDRLPQIRARLQDRNLWPVLLQLLGGDDASWQNILTETLGVQSNAAMMRLFRERVALAAPDWRGLDEGIILFTQADRRAVRALVDQRRRRSVRTEGRVRITQTRTGLWIALAGKTVVLARQQGPGTLFDKSVALLNGRSENALAASDEFRTRVASLPFPRFGCAFWTAGPQPATTTRPAASLSRWWPPLRSGALSLRVRGHQLEMTFRGASNEQGDFRYRPRVLLQPMLALPQTTLAAWATSIDAKELFDIARQGSVPGQLQPLWETLQARADAARFQEEVIANIGDRCLVLLAADFTSDSLPPQLGFMIESVDGEAVVKTLRDLAEQIVETVNSNGEPEPTITLSDSDHLGTTVHELHLKRSSSGALGVTFASLIADEMVLSFAAVKGWVVLATSPGHVRQIIDASNGLAPRLEPILRLDERGEQLRRSIGAALVQPSLAVGALRYWNIMLRQHRRISQGRSRLGISVHTAPRAGQVVIADVHSNGPSAGILEPDDAVLACNGHLLRMDAANDDLRTLLIQASPDQPVRLRLLREGEIVEESIPPSVEGLQLLTPTGLAALLDKLAPLEHFVLGLASATYFVERSPDGAYHSQLMLDFEQPPAPEVPTSDADAGSSPP